MSDLTDGVKAFVARPTRQQIIDALTAARATIVGLSESVTRLTGATAALAVENAELAALNEELATANAEWVAANEDCANANAAWKAWGEKLQRDHAALADAYAVMEKVAQAAIDRAAAVPEPDTLAPPAIWHGLTDPLAAAGDDEFGFTTGWNRTDLAAAFAAGDALRLANQRNTTEGR